MDRAIPPSPRRLHLAWQAGVRSRPRWLVSGAFALGIGLAFDVAVRALAPWWRATWADVDAGGVPDMAGLAVVGLAWGAVVLLGLAAVVVGHALAGALGPVSAQARERLGAVALRAPVIGISLVAPVLATVIGLALWSAAAGAARAVDAPADALVEVWQIWLVRGLTIGGAALLVAGLIETLLWRRRITFALHQSVDQARDEQRRGGAARR